MLNVITTTRTLTRTSGETVEFTEWTVGGYTLCKIVEAGYTDWTVRAPHDLPSITGLSVYGDKTTEFGVNWSACGTQSTTDARAYAAQLATAADVADLFNRITSGN